MPGGGGTEPGILSVQVVQGDFSYWQNLVVTGESFYYLDVPGLKPGDFVLEVYRGTPSPQAAVCLSTDLTFGSFLSGDGYRSIKLDIQTTYTAPYFLAGIAALGISILFAAAALWEILHNKDGRRVPVYTAAIVLFQLVAKYPGTILNNESHHEITTVYLGSLLQEGWRGFWVPDSGYMPFFPKLLCLFLVKVMHMVQYAPLLLALASALAIAAIIAFPTTRRFSTVADLKQRFLFALLVGCTQLVIVQSQIIWVLNTAYWGTLLIAYIYMLDLEQTDKGLVPWMLLSGILIMSKASNVVLAPVLLVLFAGCLWKKRRKTALYTGYLLGSLCCQGIYILCGFGADTYSVDEHVQSFGKSMMSSAGNYLRILEKTIFKLDTNSDANALLVAATAICLAGLLYELQLCRRGDRWGFLLLALHAVSFGQILMDEWSGKWLDVIFINEDRAPVYSLSKNIFFITVFYAVWIFYILIHLKKPQVKGLALCLVFLEAIYLYPEEQYTPAALSNWTEYSTAIKSGTYAVPTNSDSMNPYFIKEKTYIAYIGNQTVYSDNDLILRQARARGADDIIRLEEDSPTRNTFDLPRCEREIQVIYGNKQLVSQTNDIWCAFYDAEMQCMARVPLSMSEELKATGFAIYPQQSVRGAAKISFEDESGYPINLNAGCYVVYF